MWKFASSQKPLPRPLTFLFPRMFHSVSFYNFTISKPISVLFKPHRHVQNNAVWLVFVPVESKSESVSLSQSVDSCSLGTQMGWSILLHKDWSNLIVDYESGSDEGWYGGFRLDKNRVFVPLYFFILSFTGSSFVQKNVLWFGKCASVMTSPIWLPSQTFSAFLGSQLGCGNFQSKYIKVKGTFKGGKFQFSEWPLVAGNAFGVMFSSHILFDPPMDHGKLPTVDFLIRSLQGIILHLIYSHQMSLTKPLRLMWEVCFPWTLTIPSLESYYAYPMSLSEFEYFCTVVYSKITPSDPSRLTSLITPFSDHATVSTLLGLSAGAAITPTPVKVKPWDLGRSAFWTYSGLVGQSLNLRGNTRFLFWHTTWLILVGFLSMTYTNILQSVVVVPGIRTNGLTTEEMIARGCTSLVELLWWVRWSVDALDSRLACDLMDRVAECLWGVH